MPGGRRYFEIMNNILSGLIPGPIAINENGITGRLFADGNLEENCLLFRFLFDRPDEIIPVFLEIRIAGKYYRCLLSSRDPANPMVKSSILIPDSNISEGIEIQSVKPLVSMLRKNETDIGLVRQLS
jgi:hypothetical protein